MNLLYLVFGTQFQHHQQAIFSMISFLRTGSERYRIFVYTDNPTFYTFVKDFVTIVPISQALLSEWQGKHRFFWRVKIKAVEHLLQTQAAKPLLYLDSDTFLKKEEKTLLSYLQENQAIMHEKEGELCKLKSKTERLMWQQCKGKNWAGIKVNEASAMWNAGAIGLPVKKQKEVVELALKVCDEMCEAQVIPRLIEQFAFSLALQSVYDLREGKEIIGHYWGNKTAYNEVIAQYWVESLLQARDMTHIFQAFPTQLPPEKVKVSNTKRRLFSLIEKIFPDKKW